MDDDHDPAAAGFDLTPRGAVVGLCVLAVVFLMAFAYFGDADRRAWCMCFGHSQGR